MYRWLLVGGLWALVGVLGAFFWLGWQVLQTGVALRLEEPRAALPVKLATPVILSTPLEVRVVSLPLEISEPLSVGVEGPVHVETDLLRCPSCGKGLLLPVRWNLLSGAITWRCLACGQEFGP